MFPTLMARTFPDLIIRQAVVLETPRISDISRMPINLFSMEGASCDRLDARGSLSLFIRSACSVCSAPSVEATFAEGDDGKMC